MSITLIIKRYTNVLFTYLITSSECKNFFQDLWKFELSERLLV